MDQLSNIESAFKGLWDKIKRAGELIAQLREEKSLLEIRNGELERERAQLRETLSEQEQLVKKLSTAPPPAPLEVNPDRVFANGEREAIAARVKELLQKIDAYL